MDGRGGSRLARQKPSKHSACKKWQERIWSRGWDLTEQGLCFDYFLTCQLAEHVCLAWRWEEASKDRKVVIQGEEPVAAAGKSEEGNTVTYRLGGRRGSAPSRCLLLPLSVLGKLGMAEEGPDV